MKNGFRVPLESEENLPAEATRWVTRLQLVLLMNVGNEINVVLFNAFQRGRKRFVVWSFRSSCSLRVLRLTHTCKPDTCSPQARAFDLTVSICRILQQRQQWQQQENEKKQEVRGGEELPEAAQLRQTRSGRRRRWRSRRQRWDISSCGELRACVWRQSIVTSPLSPSSFSSSHFASSGATRGLRRRTFRVAVSPLNNHSLFVCVVLRLRLA